MVSRHYSSDSVNSKQIHHMINLLILRFCYMCSIIIGYKNWWSYGHPNRLGQKSRGILGTCDNQYPTGTQSQFLENSPSPLGMNPSLVTLKVDKYNKTDCTCAKFRRKRGVSQIHRKNRFKLCFRYQNLNIGHAGPDSTRSCGGDSLFIFCIRENFDSFLCILDMCFFCNFWYTGWLV